MKAPLKDVVGQVRQPYRNLIFYMSRAAGFYTIYSFYPLISWPGNDVRLQRGGDGKEERNSGGKTKTPQSISILFVHS